jgi:putative selenium metabolism hydrolase
MIHGIAIARATGLLPDDMAVYVFCNMEEVNEGSAPNAFVQTEGIFPDYVVIGEPTGLNVYRGQKGRTEYQIHIQGKSAHAASNHLGDNALYKALPVIEAIKQRQDTLPADDFLGQARITVTDVTIEAGSRNVVPGAVTVYVDRRLIPGETAQGELTQLQQLIGERDDITLSILEMTDPSYTGFIFPLDAVYPAWVLPENAPLVQHGLETGKLIGLDTIQTGKWDFSTNGVYWAGKLRVPTIGFGPGDEIHAHTVLDQVPLDEVIKATEWYALFPALAQSEADS